SFPSSSYLSTSPAATSAHGAFSESRRQLAARNAATTDEPADELAGSDIYRQEVRRELQRVRAAIERDRSYLARQLASASAATTNSAASVGNRGKGKGQLGAPSTAEAEADDRFSRRGAASSTAIRSPCSLKRHSQRHASPPPATVARGGPGGRPWYGNGEAWGAARGDLAWASPLHRLPAHREGGSTGALGEAAWESAARSPGSRHRDRHNGSHGGGRRDGSPSLNDNAESATAARHDRFMRMQNSDGGAASDAVAEFERSMQHYKDSARVSPRRRGRRLPSSPPLRRRHSRCGDESGSSSGSEIEPVANSYGASVSTCSSGAADSPQRRRRKRRQPVGIYDGYGGYGGNGPSSRSPNLDAAQPVLPPSPAQPPHSSRWHSGGRANSPHSAGASAAAGLWHVWPESAREKAAAAGGCRQRSPHRAWRTLPSAADRNRKSSRSGHTEGIDGSKRQSPRNKAGDSENGGDSSSAKSGRNHHSEWIGGSGDGGGGGGGSGGRGGRGWAEGEPEYRAGAASGRRRERSRSQEWRAARNSSGGLGCSSSAAAAAAVESDAAEAAAAAAALAATAAQATAAARDAIAEAAAAAAAARVWQNARSRSPTRWPLPLHAASSTATTADAGAIRQAAALRGGTLAAKDRSWLPCGSRSVPEAAGALRSCAHRLSSTASLSDTDEDERDDLGGGGGRGADDGASGSVGAAAGAARLNNTFASTDHSFEERQSPFVVSYRRRNEGGGGGGGAGSAWDPGGTLVRPPLPPASGASQIPHGPRLSSPAASTPTVAAIASATAAPAIGPAKPVVPSGMSAPTGKATSPPKAIAAAATEPLELVGEVALREELTKQRAMVALLRQQLSSLGETPAEEAVPLAVARQRLREAMDRLMTSSGGGGGDKNGSGGGGSVGGESGGGGGSGSGDNGGAAALREFEKWDKIVRHHPEQVAEEKQRVERWAEENDTKNKAALRQLRTFVPPDVFQATAESLTERGLVPALAKRVFEKKALWLCRAPPDFLRRCHVVELRGKYATTGLDLPELRAVFASLPPRFENDAGGEKAMWRQDVFGRLQDLVTGAEQGRLRPAEARHPVYAAQAAAAPAATAGGGTTSAAGAGTHAAGPVAAGADGAGGGGGGGGGGVMEEDAAGPFDPDAEGVHEAVTRSGAFDKVERPSVGQVAPELLASVSSRLASPPLSKPVPPPSRRRIPRPSIADGGGGEGGGDEGARQHRRSHSAPNSPLNSIRRGPPDAAILKQLMQEMAI
ncbi:unnamed protein product, partial [Phaeothamnion confervicola]